MSNKPPHFFVLSSPSGGGKTTLIKQLLEESPDLRLSVSYTTREPRPGEQEGIDYYFISEDEFQRKINCGDLLEWEEVHGCLYGTGKSEVLSTSSPVIFDVDTNGALKLRGLYPETTLIFIKPPSLEVLERRLIERGTESEERIAARLERFRIEMAQQDKFDYVIINDEINRAVAELKSIIQQKESTS